MGLIDTHCHLFLEEFDTDRAEVINSSVQKGINKMILPNVDVATIKPLQETTIIKPAHLYGAMGLHPCSVKSDFKDVLKSIEYELKGGNYVAVGEIGIDLYWDKTYLKEQELALHEQINWALELNLPVILHCRDSFDNVYEIVKQYPSLTGVFHAFTGTYDQALKVMSLGFYMGIGGVVTFKNSGLDKVVEQIPLKHVVLETDSPYLTPTPFRGKRNLPEYTQLVAQKISEIQNLPFDEVSKITTQNALALFRI